jgi:SAM-dependent methyltransferase/uncharacterized protein YbaR (Trm112 family)
MKAILLKRKPELKTPERGTPGVLSAGFSLPGLRLHRVCGAAALLALACGLLETSWQWREDRMLDSIAREVVAQAGATDNRARVLALQAYLGQRVTWHGAIYDRRQFLRATAAETLQSGKGYCGEVTRAFVRLAAALGIRAHRMNFYGRDLHVMAEAVLGPGDRVIVDCQAPPHVAGLERREQVLARPEFDEYSTFNLRRFGLEPSRWVIRRELGMLGDWLECPHLMKAGALFLAAFLLAGVRLRMKRAALGRDFNRESTLMTQPDRVSSLLRCPDCNGRLSFAEESPAGHEETSFVCLDCRRAFPIRGGIPRLLPLAMQNAFAGDNGAVDPRRVATAESFGYEWTRFSEMRLEWERNFLDYLAPHPPEWLRGKLALDAGCGSGRHAFYAAQFGAEVWAVDLGPAVEVARRNNAGSDRVRVVQADLHNLPFATESFDLIYSIGVLHHLPDPEMVFRNLLRYVKPGGWIHVYLYWQPEGQPVKRALLSLVTTIRRLTTWIPHALLYYLSFPAAMIAIALFVWPYRLLRAFGLRRLADKLPMKQYALYPFRVCVNDQFDRFSAPIEFRYTCADVMAWFERAGLEEITVTPNYGWVGTGRKPQ